MSRPFLPLLGGATVALAVIASHAHIGHAQTSTVTTGPNGVSGSTTITNNGKPCRVVHSDDANGTGTLSSSVTAGPGGVKSSTTGGPSVTVNSGNGSSSSSSSAASSGNGTTMTTTSDGECVVTVPKGK